MTEIFDASLMLSQLRLPPQDIKVLSFCASNKVAKVAGWASQLRLTQTRQTSVSLYDAIPEIAHLKTDAKTRFDMLEAIWPAASHCSIELAKDFLLQPLILPPTAQKTAILAQALQKYLLDGYLVCIQDLLLQKKLKSPQLALLNNCIYQSMRRVSQIMLRCFQLYTIPPSEMWHILHLLYRIAEERDLLTTPAEVAIVEKSGCRTVVEAYTRACALASLRPNQLSQNDITHAYNALEHWARQIKVKQTKVEDSSALFFINLNGESGPVTRNRFKAGDFDEILEFKIDDIAEQIRQQLSSGAKRSEMGTRTVRGAIDIPANIPSILLEHMVRCWTADLPRAQSRKRSDILAQASFGLSDAHYHICGGKSLDEFVEASASNHEGDDNKEDSVESLLSKLGQSASSTASKQNGPKTTCVNVKIRNASEGGYCVTWQSDECGRIESGELISIKEINTENWSIGVVRWIRQMKNATQAGIQLITNQPVAYAAAMMYDMGGETDFMRALHVPAPSSPDIEPGILTPSAPFKEHCRAKLKQNNKLIRVKLKKCVLSTNKIRLFSFETDN